MRYNECNEIGSEFFKTRKQIKRKKGDEKDE